MRRSARRRATPPDFPAAQLGQIPLIALRYAVVVAEVLNFRHAAEVMGVAQSSVSARIKTLEETLGIALFERRHRGVRLTEAGRRFIAEVAAGIGHLEYAIRTAGSLSSGAEGRVAIGLHTSLAFGFLADLRRIFTAAYPAVEQVIMEGRSSETIALIRNGHLDVAFVIGAVEAPDCHSRELWQEPIMVALPTNHRLALMPSIMWADLAPEIFLVRNGGSGPQMFEHIVRRIVEREQSVHTQRHDVGRDTLMHMVAAGDGITLTTEAVTHVPFPGIVFLPIADETIQLRFSAVWSPHNRSSALRNLLALATEMSQSTRSL